MKIITTIEHKKRAKRHGSERYEYLGVILDINLKVNDQLQKKFNEDYIQNKATITSVTKHKPIHCRDHLQSDNSSCHALLFKCFCWHNTAEEIKTCGSSR